MHVTIGDEESVVSRPALIKITKEAPAEIKEYYEWPGINHYVINDGLYLEDVVANQLEFLAKIVEK